MEHHPAFRRAAAGDLLAMKPERQRIPADVVSISDLRAAREAARTVAYTTAAAGSTGRQRAVR